MTFHSTYRYRVLLLSILLLTACGGGSEETKETPQYTITTSANGGGEVTPASIDVASGQSTDFELSADDGFVVTHASGCNGTLNGTTYSTGNITSACAVTVTFETVEVAHEQTAPSVDILFPWTSSRTDADTLVVRGIASDPNGVAAIRVNGIEAEIQTNTSASLAKTTNTRQLSSTNETVENTEVNWQVSIPVSKPTLKISVESEDNLGNTDESASANVISYNLPSTFTLDNINNRLIGRNSYDSLLTVDLLTKEVSKITLTNASIETRLDRASNIEYIESQNSIIYPVWEENILSLYSIDLNSKEISSLIHHELDSRPVNITMDFSQSENILYLNLVYWSTDEGPGKSHIVKYVMETGEITTVANGTTASGKRIYSGDIAYSDNGLVVFNDLHGAWYDGLLSLAFDGSDLVTLTEPENLEMSRITVDVAAGIVYQTGTEGVIKVDLTTREKINISPSSEETELNFSSYYGSNALDLSNQKLLVHEWETDVIISVDLENGERAEFLSNGIGTGIKIAQPRSITLDVENNIVYVLDGGINENEAIVSVDLATGNRKLISKIKTLQDDGDVYDMVLDSAAQQLYVLLERREIIRIDIASQTSTVFSSSTVGSGVDFDVLTGMTLDKGNNRLLTTDWRLMALLAIDLSTGERTIIADSDTVGNGDFFNGPDDVEFDTENNRAFILNGDLGAIFSVDLSNGHSEQILDTCLNDDLEDVLVPDVGYLSRISFNAASRQLLIGARNLLSYDVDSNTCLSSSTTAPLDFILTDDNQIFAVGSNKLELLDFKSAETVTISK
ncbi:hypothetical protein [Thalassomonas actiniarum]|uniref:Uncharacterized protein n=1 Tax=Thalassomonas actiniarum TaxID=485447 RepID=A0AAE9YQV7_9GAMM|nr:hypothetical protein [Thalassomonas actiniarum]WDD97916.1 hypothetical protein SG35_021895 [Thalassomonas actiniarum]